MLSYSKYIQVLSTCAYIHIQRKAALYTLSEPYSPSLQRKGESEEKEEKGKRKEECEKHVVTCYALTACVTELFCV